jgi:hypothetical protein
MIFKSSKSDTYMRQYINSWILYISLVIIVLTVVFGGIKYFTKVFNADNAVHNYERFFDYKREYDTRISQIASMKQQLVTFADDKQELVRITQELAAVRMSCLTLANTYNNDSSKLTREYFKSSSLPSTLSSEACEQ